MESLSFSIEESLEPQALEQLQRRWLRLCAGLQLGQEQANAQWEELSNHYHATGRYYHNFSHIRNLLELWDAQEPTVAQKPIFELAFWLHDIIYQPLKKDNEVASAEWAMAHWSETLEDEQQSLLERLILSTEHHRPRQNTWKEGFFLDHDLSIFAARPADYEDYRAAIRKEYQEVPAPAYRAGRLRILQHFLERERLFFTDTFYEKYEKQARANLQREKRELQEG